MPQEPLSLEAGVQRKVISLIETGQNQPTISTITPLARALNLKAAERVAAAQREGQAPPRRGARRPSDPDCSVEAASIPYRSDI